MDLPIAPRNYRPQRSCGQGNIFTLVCHSVHRGVVVSHKALRQTPPDQTHHHHPRTRHTIPLDQAHHPPDQAHPPRSRLRHTVYEWPVRILLECILVLIFCYYRPQRSWGKVILSEPCVKNSVHGGGLPHCMLGYTPRDQRQAPPGTRQPPSAVHAGRYGQQAGGAHPNGMQSCFLKWCSRSI